MSKHTPGPWNTYVNDHRSVVVRKMFDDGTESHEIARCCSGFANARLIAAAPDLLQGCKEALDALEALQGGCTDSDDGTVEAITVWCPEVVEDLRAAIAKAEVQA